MTETKLILASTSPFRKMLLENAGIEFATRPADVDERAIETGLVSNGASPEVVAKALAEAKALSVSIKEPDAMIIGSDQTLSLEQRVFHKPASSAEAKQQLQFFSGKTHQLNSGVALARAGKIIWSDVTSAKMTVRPLSNAFIDRYLAKIGKSALASVGAYQLEGVGIQLFEAIDGDYFTIVGLPLLPLLSALRDFGAVDG